MVLHPTISRARIDTCYLDTTYLNPKYCFPPQPQVIDACANLARRTALGINPDAPPLQEIKPNIKLDLDLKPKLEEESGNGTDIKEVDVKPDMMQDAYAAAAEMEEKSKAMMQGWLVKRESGDDVKEELNEIGQKEMKPKGRTLIVMGTYSIGKERIVKGEL